MNFPKILRGVTGEPELIRLGGALSLAALDLSAIGFEWWNMWRGEKFDVTAYCLAFSGGIAGVLGSIGAGTAIKDKAVAQARATESQTSNAT